MQKVQEMTQSRVTVGPGTLYSLLGDFQQEGFIHETKVEQRKRSYILTPAGRSRLAFEYRRLQTLTEDYRNNQIEEV